ncbi:MAG: MoaD/ThiS family protein [Campylobacteraceae bacterium]|jgi:molybdopterin synthase sulfur carrier subunit|nr:MoaD/ThiS family protein [Campylobacteraceae bacterium]
MAKVEFLGPLSNKESLEVDIKNLQELRDILKKDSEISKWLDVCSIAVNDELVFNMDIKIDKNDKIVLLPPVCGG